MARVNSESWADLGLYSLLKSPFLFPSLAFHLMLFYLFSAALLSVKPDEANISIPIRLVELGSGQSRDKSIGPARGPGGPRALPKLGSPVPPRQSSGRVDAGAPEDTPASKEPAPAPEVSPALPRPKVLAEVPRAFGSKESSPESLVRLPTRASATSAAPTLTAEPSQKSSGASKATGAGEGIRALQEGFQLPGALKGTGANSAPYGVPGGIREGKGISGGGTGTGTGGGSSSGLRGTWSEDYNLYLKQIEKRVKSVWKYPEEVAGVQKVSVRFTLDKAGKLTRAEIMDSTDSRINGSALEAMKKASPFPPIPENLRELAGEPLIIRIIVTIRVRG